MKREIRLTVEVPDTATDEEIEEYFMYEFDYNGSCSNDNPFSSDTTTMLWILNWTKDEQTTE